MWNERYAKPGYLFGKEPARFLTRMAPHLPAGADVLCAADGEGRNSVWLAGQGHTVTAFDFSPVAVEKAIGLASEMDVAVDVRHAGIEDWDWSVQHDAVVAIFVQFTPPDLRAKFFDWMGQAVRPGGLMLLHGYAPRQVEYGTGGPPMRSHMYTTQMLEEAFAGWDLIELADYDAEIDEGEGHSGRSALVDMVARKPA